MPKSADHIEKARRLLAPPEAVQAGPGALLAAAALCAVASLSLAVVVIVGPATLF